MILYFQNYVQYFVALNVYDFCYTSHGRKNKLFQEKEEKEESWESIQGLLEQGPFFLAKLSEQKNSTHRKNSLRKLV